MISYSFVNPVPPGSTIKMVHRGDGTYIPLVQANTDCVKFLKDWGAGATVTNADGSTVPYSDSAVTELGLEIPQ